jgi:lipopolysaccharide biosynthesis glycosyltransferase
MHLAVATDARYLPWCATTLLSCLLATPDRPIAVHVLHGEDLSTSDRVRLRTMVSDAGADLDLLDIDDSRVAHLPTKGPDLGGRVSWWRVLLPELLPDADRIVYLDSDTLVLESLASLWHTALDDHPLAAVPNVIDPPMRSHARALGIEPIGGYFNAGVLVMNLELMRADRSYEAITAFVRDHGATDWYDQDALNVVFARRWLGLHPRWNAQNSYWFWPDVAVDVLGRDGLEQATATPAIVHFEGPSVMKPWHYLCEHPYTSRYRDILGRTPWGDVGLEDRTIATRAIRLLPSSRRLHAYVRLQQRRRDKLSTPS